MFQFMFSNRRWKSIIDRDVISLYIRSMWETTVMHKQVSGWTVNFGPNFPESPFLELKTRKPPAPISENFRFEMTKVYSGIPPHFGKLQIWDDQTLLQNTSPPHFGKLQIWDDQSLLRNTPPVSENFRFGMTKVYSGIPPSPPILESFKFGMTKVYSGIPPSPPPFWKASDLGWPKFTPEYPPPQWKLSESPSPRFSEYRELLHVETLSNPDNY